ncbi:hypothetical protein BH11PAT2_BH11PAT2_00300 [soil metagenome]
MNTKKILLPISLLLIIIVGLVIAMSRNNAVSEPAYTNETKGSVSSSSSSTSYTPTPIDRSKLLSGKFTENRSPDGKFISHTFDNEQGDSGVYLTTNSGTDVSATYCGFFKEWSPDSKEITVFVPEECGKGVSKNETFNLYVDGTVSR